MAARQVLLVIGGEERELRFGLSAWAALEDHGISVDSVFGTETTEKMPLRTIHRLLWAMLQTANGKSPSMEDVGRWVDLRNFKAVVEKVKEAIRDGMPDPGEPVSPPAVGGIGGPPADSPSGPSSSPPISSGG